MTSHSPRFRRPAFAAALLAASALTGVAGWAVAPAAAETAAPHAAPIDAARPAAQALPGFADLVDRVHPAVVTVTTTARQTMASADADEPGSPAEGPGGFFGAPGPGAARTVHALGSGFLVDAVGHIVTNNHVVKDATDIHVTLSDGRELPARLVGADARTDLAVLQVKTDAPLPHLALGDSDAVRVGDWVVAVGNPFGLGGTVTAGILSARGREIGQGPYDDFLQIDAPINRGNSGGPLFAQDGTVIGVNTAIYSPSGGSVGIGFAIPAKLVRQVVDQLETHGRVERGWLGVSAQPLTPALATAMGLGKPEGALVAEVQHDSPAAAAGVQSGDVITTLGGQAVHDPRGLARLVAALHPGQDTPLTVHRDGADRTLSVGIKELREASAGPDEAERGRALGLALAPLDARARQALNLPAGNHGVVVAGVRQDSPAENAGLRAGDVLEGVGRHAVGTPEEAVAALREAGTAGGAVALRVLRDGRTAFMALRLPDSKAG